MRVQCKICGHSQEFLPSYPYCSNCGANLDISSEERKKIPKKLKNIEGIAILLFFCFIVVFFFLSRFFGTIGAIISLIIWIIAKFLERKK